MTNSSCAHDRGHGQLPICEMALHASLESLDFGPAATILARDALVSHRWAEWGTLFDTTFDPHPRELRRQTAAAHPVVRSLRDKPDSKHTMRLHRVDDVPQHWTLGPNVLTAGWSYGDIRPSIDGPSELSDFDGGDVDLLVDDDVPWAIVKATLDRLYALDPNASFGLVFRGEPDAPALVRLAVSVAAHVDSPTREMSCAGIYERVPSTLELQYNGALSFRDVASMLDCMCSGVDCSQGITLHDWRAPTAAAQVP